MDLNAILSDVMTYLIGAGVLGMFSLSALVISLRGDVKAARAETKAVHMLVGETVKGLQTAIDRLIQRQDGMEDRLRQVEIDTGALKERARMKDGD